MEPKFSSSGEVGKFREPETEKKPAQAPENMDKAEVKCRLTPISLGGERRIDIARGYGYKDGSAITQILKRLQNAARTEPPLADRMSRLKIEMERSLSTFSGLLPKSRDWS